MEHWLISYNCQKQNCCSYFCMHVQNLGPNPTTKAMRQGRFQPRHLGNHLTDFDDILKPRIYPDRLPPCKIWYWSDNMGGLGQYPVCHSKVSCFVFGSHRMHSIDAVYCDRRSSVVSRDVIWGVTEVGPRNHALDGVQIPTWRCSF